MKVMNYPVFSTCTSYDDGVVVTYEGKLRIFYHGRFYDIPDGITEPEDMLTYAKEKELRGDNLEIKEKNNGNSKIPM